MHVQTNKHWKEVIPYLQDKITQEKVTPTLLKKIKSYPSYTLGLYILTAISQRRKAKIQKLAGLFVFRVHLFLVRILFHLR